MRYDLFEALESRLGLPIDEDSIRDVKPGDCGHIDESWYVFATADGRWHTYSDHGDQLESHATEEAALAYWQEVEPVVREWQRDNR